MLVTKPVETQSRAESRWPAVESIGVALALTHLCRAVFRSASGSPWFPFPQDY